jgi:hypothetical protein
MTISKMTLSLMILSLVILSLVTLSLMTLSIMTLRKAIKTFQKHKNIQFNDSQHNDISITAANMVTHKIMMLSIETLSITIFFIVSA